MMKNVLGRGVGALLPEDNLDEADRFFMCDIEKISANPNQPRSHFDAEKLQQLADSIREKGVIQPLLVTQGNDNRYVLIAGERRLRAAKLAGREEVPVVVMDKGSDNESLELALIENIQRHDLNPIEEAVAYGRLMEEFHLTQEEVAKKVGRQRSTITNVLRLLQLPQSLQDDVVQGRDQRGARPGSAADQGSAGAVAGDPRPDCQRGVVGAGHGTVVHSKKHIIPHRRQMRPPSPPPAEELPKSYCAALVTQLTNQLHSKVRIVQQGKRGKLEIEYYSSDDLDRLVSLLSR